ncbi:hypothetical protein F8M41_008092 [Gigaspora margarita]|uniref:Uncharacterized protein n=1 Tax=Gigaspora margarita TaxID=4874 RepID=A0A8H4A3X1_GIGMA|nr:hypothetical protein F8M41_008092 [Gigaspora margarita]
MIRVKVIDTVHLHLMYQVGKEFHTIVPITAEKKERKREMYIDIQLYVDFQKESGQCWHKSLCREPSSHAVVQGTAGLSVELPQTGAKGPHR